MKRLLIPLILLHFWATAGCGAGQPSGVLRAESLGRESVVLIGRYVTAFYAQNDSAETTSFFLSDLPLEQLLSGRVDQGLVVHLDLLWIPEAGATPMDSSATNATIRYIVIASGEVGIYGGAGFAVPHGEPGQNTLTVSLRDASLTLLESTDGFVDLLSPARLTGDFTAVLDSRRARQIHYAVSQLVTDALGRSRLVRSRQHRVSGDPTG
ncbi:MAG: hypothetical protein IH830_13305 [Planctomycetes bacterium]|nr:hypothetical protein [Planctomycetota bacterium]